MLSGGCGDILRSRQLEGAKFVRQFPIAGFVVDFACRDAHLGVELDGGHHSAPGDAPRTEIIERFGHRVIRFWNNDVFENTGEVLKAIRQELLNARGRGG